MPTATDFKDYYTVLGVSKTATPEEIKRTYHKLALRRDLGLNLVGAAMVLDMATEIAQLRAQLKVYQSHPS